MTVRSELDTRSVTNPLDEDFTVTWDKVEYTVPAGETKSFAGFLAVHFASHLADRLLINSGRYADKINNMTGQHTARAVGKPEKTELMKLLLDAEKQIDVKDALEAAAKAAAGGDKGEAPKEKGELAKKVEKEVNKKTSKK